ncbi:hypothetical protein OROHE_018598 [Orobanche hederae]
MRLLKKCGKRVDKINELSDDIILHILSFIPTVDACDAGLVCRRWFHLWGCIPKLTFKFPYYKGISQIIPHIERALSLTLALNSHKALSFSSLQEFKLDFRVLKKFQHLVSRWLAYAFSRGVERLHLNLGDDGAIFDKHMLKEIASFEPLNLKVLVLKCIMMKDDALELFLPNCPLLERLHICRPMRRLDLVIDGAVIDSPSLKHLDMRSRSFKSELGDSMHHFANVAAQLQTLIIHLFNPKRYRGVRRCGDKDFGHFYVSLELVRFVVDNCVALEEIVIGKCHPVGLVRNIVDYGEESLDHIIMDPVPPLVRGMWPHSRNGVLLKKSCNANKFLPTLSCILSTKSTHRSCRLHNYMVK